MPALYALPVLLCCIHIYIGCFSLISSSSTTSSCIWFVLLCSFFMPLVCSATPACLPVLYYLLLPFLLIPSCYFWRIPLPCRLPVPYLALEDRTHTWLEGERSIWQHACMPVLPFMCVCRLPYIADLHTWTAAIYFMTCSVPVLPCGSTCYFFLSGQKTLSIYQN